MALFNLPTIFVCSGGGIRTLYLVSRLWAWHATITPQKGMTILKNVYIKPLLLYSVSQEGEKTQYQYVKDRPTLLKDSYLYTGLFWELFSPMVSKAVIHSTECSLWLRFTI